mmetsp:Transcript_4679/g.10070  ORF Transcript_4679/g.10070 Transcript_4679/m.10070 type:complete len:241 (-) Transcript_4679:994-1716(-)
MLLGRVAGRRGVAPAARNFDLDEFSLASAAAVLRGVDTTTVAFDDHGAARGGASPRKLVRDLVVVCRSHLHVPNPPHGRGRPLLETPPMWRLEHAVDQPLRRVAHLVQQRRTQPVLVVDHLRCELNGRHARVRVVVPEPPPQSRDPGRGVELVRPRHPHGGEGISERLLIELGEGVGGQGVAILAEGQRQRGPWGALRVRIIRPDVFFWCGVAFHLCFLLRGSSFIPPGLAGRRSPSKVV